MTEFDRFALTLADIESTNSEYQFGDHGRACGRWQMHPEFYDDYFPRPPRAGASWNDCFEAALKAFWLKHRASYPVPALAMIYHLGLAGWLRGDHDDAYLEKFGRVWAEYGAAINAKTEVS